MFDLNINVWFLYSYLIICIKLSILTFCLFSSMRLLNQLHKRINKKEEVKLTLKLNYNIIVIICIISILMCFGIEFITLNDILNKRFLNDSNILKTLIITITEIDIAIILICFFSIIINSLIKKEEKENANIQE